MNKKEGNANASRMPPSNFNLIDRPFQPTWDYELIEGLKETVQRLHRQGRFRSALDEIFKALDKHPNHPQALMLAMIVVGESRMGRLQAEEPLTPAYVLDTRLDPIFTVCSHCKKYTWVSLNWVLADRIESMTTFDPSGLQCYNCGYVVCRDCLNELTPRGEIVPVSTSCPNCGQDELNTPVYPTGRLPKQMERYAAPIVRIIVFREGPVPPDGEYIKKLLEVHSPDALRTNVTLTGIPKSPWPDNIESIAISTLIAMESRDEIPVGSVRSTEHAHIRDEYGTRVYMVKVMQPSAEEAEASAETRKTVEEIARKAFDKALKRQIEKERRPGFLKKLFSGRRKKRGKAVDLIDAGPLASSLRRCKKCGALYLRVGLVGCIFSNGGTADHEHTFESCSEPSVIDTKYGGSEQAYLRAIDLMFEELPGLMRNRDARLIWADCLERLARLEGEIPSDAVEAYAHKALTIYHKVKAHDLAAAELQKAVNLDPVNLHYRNQMAIQYFLSDNWQKAEEAWMELLRIHPSNTDATSNYAAALSQMAQKDPARQIDYYKKALDLEPKSQRRCRDLGVACQDAGRWEEAITCLEKAITYATEPLDTKSVADFEAKVKDRLGTCYSRLGHYAKAIQCWTEALTETDWDEDAKSIMLSDLQRTRELVKLLDEDTASPLDTRIQNLITNHLNRLINEFGNHQLFVIAKPDYDYLFRPDILAITKAAAKRELPKSLRDDQHHWQTHRLGDLILIVSTVPVILPREARSYFHPNYLEFLGSQLQAFSAQKKKTIVAHWTFCSDVENTGTHLTFFPREGMKVIAQDLLTDAEKSQLGL